MLASARGSKEAVEWLLDHGAKKEILNQEGISAADIANKNNHQEIYSILK